MLITQFSCIVLRQSDVDLPLRWNIMTMLTMIAFATPVLGLAVAFLTYGSHWGELHVGWRFGVGGW